MTYLELLVRECVAVLIILPIVRMILEPKI